MPNKIVPVNHTTPAGRTFRVSTWSPDAPCVIEAGGVEVMEPNLWKIQVHTRPGTTAAGWNRSDLGDPVFELMTIELVAVQVDIVAERTEGWNGPCRCLSAYPTFTAEGNWRWSGKPLSEGSIAHAAYTVASQD